MNVWLCLDVRTLRHGRGGPLFATFALAVSIFAGSPVLAQPESGESLDYEALAAAVDRLGGKLERIREAVDHTRFDPDELVFSLDFDGGAIVRFVNEKIAFHPYRGLLRGVGGTLQTRAGNALDQSLLLAYLLKTAGLDARVVRGELTEAQARGLLGRTARPPADEDLARLEAAVRETFGEEAARGGDAVKLGETRFGREASATVERLETWLKQAGKVPDAGKLNAALAESLKEYFWVEYRLGPGEDWQAAHPAFGADPGFQVAPAEYMADEIPETYHHRLTVEAFLRQRTGDKYQDRRLMKAYTRPVANLHGVVLSYRNHASGIRPETLGNLAEALDADQIMTPVFGGGLAPGAQAFDLKGRTIDPMVLGPQAGGAAALFRSLSDKMESATASLKDPDDPKAIFELDAMWLEFTHEAPGGEKAVQRRYLLPPRGDGTRQPHELLFPLITEYAYVVNAGDVSLQYLADRYLATGIDSLATYKAMAHKLIKPDEGTPIPDDPPQAFGPLALYRVMGASPLAADGLVPVRHRPAVVGLKMGLRDADTAFTAVDIVFNDQLQLVTGNDGVRHDPAAALRQGVWETAVEMMPGELRSEEAVSRVNTMAVFDAAREQGIDIRVLAGEGEASGLKMDAGARGILERDLAAGHVVVVPAAVPEGLGMSGWWRIDPVTGTALGLTADGHGQDAVEYLTELTLVSIGLVRAIGNLGKCAKLKDNVHQACCLVKTHINNVAGLGFGGLLGKAFGTSTAAVFEIVDFTVEQATGSGIAPSVDLDCDVFEGHNL